MQDAADGFKDGGFRGVAAAREADDVLVRERPVGFANAAIVPDREVANPHDPTPARLRANRGSITGSCRRFSNPVLRCGKWAAHWRLWGTAKARRARLRAVAGRARSWTGLTRPGFASDNCRIDDGLELGTQFSTTGWGPHGTNAGRFKQGEADGDITLRPQRADLPADRERRRGLPRPRGQALRGDRRRPGRLRARPPLRRHGALPFPDR